MPVFECTECDAINTIQRGRTEVLCHKCNQKFKVNWFKAINYEGKPLGFVHAKIIRTAVQADIFLDLDTLRGTRRSLDVNKGRGSVVS